MDKKELKIAMEVLNKVSVEFPDTKGFTEERLYQKHSKENIFIEEIT